MNETNEINTSAADTVTTLSPAPPQKTGHSKLLIGVAAACVVAIVGVAVKLSSTPDPKATVEAAFTATSEQQKASVEKIYQDIPAAKRLFEGRDGALTSDFDITIKSIEDNPYAGFANAILKDGGIRGSISSDPDNQTAALNASVYLKDSTMIEANAFVSPELIAASVPTFSDTAVSFNPTSLAQDYQNSAFATMGLASVEELQIMQGVISGEIEYLNAINAISSEKMLSDIVPIFKSALTNATYTYDKQSKNYVVNIPGEDLKAAILDYYRYIYFDSELGSGMETMLSAVAAESGMTYEEMMTETIDGIGKSLPDMEAVLTLDIKKGLIKTANLTCVPVVSEESSSEPEAADLPLSPVQSIICDCTFDGTNSSVKLVVTADSNINMTIDATSKLEDSIYALDMAVSANYDNITFNMPVQLSLGADGAYTCTADADISNGSDPITAGFSFDGNATVENDALTINLPDTKVYASLLDAGSGTMVFDVNYTNAPLSEELTAPENVSLFAMDAQQIEQLGNEYSVGYESLVGQLFSLLMG